MAQKSKFDQFAEDMQMRQIAQQLELERQTRIQQQMANHQQMTQFAVWKDTSDGQRYLSWLDQVQNIFQQSRKIQAEFSTAYAKDLQAVNAEVIPFFQALEKSKKPLVIKINWLIWLIIISLPLIFSSFASQLQILFFTGVDDSYWLTPIKYFGLGLVVEIGLIIIYPIIRKNLIMRQAKRAWETSFPGDPGFQEKIKQCRWLIDVYMNLKSRKINNDYDLIKQIYKNQFDMSFKHRSWYHLREINGMSLIDYYNRFIDDAPKNLPTNLPAVRMPSPAPSRDFPPGTQAANFLVSKFNA